MTGAAAGSYMFGYPQSEAMDPRYASLYASSYANLYGDMTSMYPYHRYFDARGQYSAGGSSQQYDYSQLQNHQHHHQQQQQQQQQQQPQETASSPREEASGTENSNRHYDACLLANRGTSGGNRGTDGPYSQSSYPPPQYPTRSESSTSEADTSRHTDEFKDRNSAGVGAGTADTTDKTDSSVAVTTQPSVIMRRTSSGGHTNTGTQPAKPSPNVSSEDQTRSTTGSYSNGQCTYDTYSAKQAYHNNHHHHHHLNHHQTAAGATRYPVMPQAGYTSVIVDAQQYHNGYVH